jgi:DNA-binding transcriptional regulator LsrR (DeoR family)
MKRHHPEVYVAMKSWGLSNRRIADHLGVDEATVRRGLKKAAPVAPKRGIHEVLAELADLLEQH